MKKILVFFQSASAGGIILLLASILGIIGANSTFSQLYFGFLDYELGSLSIALWINDALMAIFFLLVGLEVKRELLHGELDTMGKRILPGIAAVFGVVGPALIYILFNSQNPTFSRGWAVPTATDIAFALGIVAILGAKVPASLKVFITALAVIDDLIAILIIALFYTDYIALPYLIGALFIIGILFFMNRKGYVHSLGYIILGFLLWLCILKSGLHATLAGVILALMLPYEGSIRGKEVFPILQWEEALQGAVTFFIIPLFGFANAGVSFQEFQLSYLLHPIVLGIAGGLFLGKQVGIFSSVYLLVKLKVVNMPENSSWTHVYGISLLCGIGFTMSLFVSLLGFTDMDAREMAKIGIFLGSIISGIMGYIVLRYSKSVT